MFSRVLIANRGEIACRIIRTLHRLGIEAIAVRSDADRDALHVARADRAFHIGPAPAAESYLRIEAILNAAVRAGAEAVHPGYGFLAENAAFARACGDAGIVFIGPPPEVIEAMGAKDRAKAIMEGAGLPVVPGYHGELQDAASLRLAADEIGYPILLKAVAGGGGKGMRVVERPAEFPAALEGAKREAMAAFGDDRMLIEPYLARPRHIEVQVFGDRHGNVVHLYERDCSVQRRHQKVIEEAPAPGLRDEDRARLGELAVRAARAVDYVGAGTVEFLVDDRNNIYFMEMNTRLQVEHPITEMITGLDLVEWQLRIAAGEALPLAQEDITLSGHAIEARLYAEDPERGFLPSTGRLEHLHLPEAEEGVRIDTGVRAGDLVSPHYDPMLAKLIAWGPERTVALRRLGKALTDSRVVGVTTNQDALLNIVEHPDFVAGAVDTGFIERAGPALLAPRSLEPQRAVTMTALWLLLRQQQEAARRAGRSGDPHAPWHRVDGWRLNDVGHQTLRLRTEGREFEIEARPGDEGHHLLIGGDAIAGRARLDEDGRLLAEIEGEVWPVRVIAQGAELHLFSADRRSVVQRLDPLAAAEAEDESGGIVTAPMPGRIVRRLVRDGERVERGAPLLVLEAMKMEHTLTAPADGRVVAVHFGEGEQVEEGAVLLDFEPAEGPHQQPPARASRPTA